MEKASSVSRGLEREAAEYMLMFGVQGCGQSSDLLGQRSVGNIPAGPQLQIGAKAILKVIGTDIQDSIWGGDTLCSLSLPLGFSHMLCLPDTTSPFLAWP